jgi:hypothetical protein
MQRNAIVIEVSESLSKSKHFGEELLNSRLCGWLYILKQQINYGKEVKRKLDLNFWTFKE